MNREAERGSNGRRETRRPGDQETGKQQTRNTGDRETQRRSYGRWEARKRSNGRRGDELVNC